MQVRKIAATVAVAASLVLAAGSAAAASGVAVVQSGPLVRNSPQYASAKAQMKAEFEKRHDALQAKEQKLAQDFQAFQKNAEVMTPGERTKQQEALVNRRNDLMQQEQKFQEDFQQRDQQLTKQLMDQIKSVVEQVAKSDGYDLVVQDPVYASPKLDITDQVLARLKQNSAGR